MTQGKGVLAGVLVFLVLFVLAGLYAGLWEGDEDGDREGTLTAPQAIEAPTKPPAEPPSTPRSGTQPVVASPPEAGAGQGKDTLAAGAAQANDTVAAAAQAKDTAAGPAVSGLALRPDGVPPGAPPEEMPSREPPPKEPPAPAEGERATAAYDSARRATEESRRSALDAGAVLLTQSLFQQAESIRSAALAAARKGRYAEAEKQMRRAELAYDRAGAGASARAKLDSARRAVASLREQVDPGSQEYAEGATWQERAAGAERAGRYEEAVAHLGRAADAYRRARAPQPSAEAARPSGATPEVPRPPAAAAEVAPPPPPPPPRAAEEPARPTEPDVAGRDTPPTQVVEKTLAELRRAIETEDLDALRRTWTSLTPNDTGNFARWFELMKDIEVRYQVRSLERAGDRIIVSVGTRYEFFNESSNKTEKQTFSQVLELAQRDGRWVVVASRQ